MQLNNGLTIAEFEAAIAEADEWIAKGTFDEDELAYLKKRQKNRKKYLKDMKEGKI